MTPQRYRQVKQILAGAYECEPGQREGYVLRACDGDAALRREVEALLVHDEKSLPVRAPTPVARMLDLDARASERDGAEPIDAAQDDLPEQIGRYRIIRRIGEGGMGVVYEAEQENPRR